MRVVRGEISLKAATLESGKTIPRLGGTDEHFSIYLASEHGRLGIVTVRFLLRSSPSLSMPADAPIADIWSVRRDARPTKAWDH